MSVEENLTRVSCVQAGWGNDGGEKKEGLKEGDGDDGSTDEDGGGTRMLEAPR